jgi:hypothetical protein
MSKKTFNQELSEEQQYKELLDVPSFIEDMEYYGDRVLVRFLVRGRTSTKSNLFIPDTKLVPTASELKTQTVEKEDEEKIIPRAVVIKPGPHCSFDMEKGDVVEIMQSVPVFQILSYTKRFNFAPEATAHENYFYIPTSIIQSKWQSIQAYQDFLKSHKKATADAEKL